MPEKISQLRKRSGEIVDFNQEKITNAIHKAALAVEIDDHKLAKKLSDQVVKTLNKKFHKNSIPAVEEVQDLVEEALIENKRIKIAKAFILYRDQHRQLRDISQATADEKLMEDYLGRADWRLKENSNMSFSVQGLNNYIASAISARYWLNKLYPENIRKAHIEGDFHIHDLGLLAPYCCGWDLKDLLVRGFRGVSEKVQSNPAKHFRSALGQIINFFYTLQGEAAGAQAFANFDTYLAPFIRYDKLSYKEVKQGLQEFMFNINVPTRVGFQCMSADTEILGKDGWKKHNEVKKGDVIATFNTDQGFIEYLPVKHVFAKKYKGKMYNLKNRISDQLISPEHRVVRKKFHSGEYVLETIEKVKELKSPFIVPVGSLGNIKTESRLSDDEIRLIAWVIAEGSLDKGQRGSGRISIYQSKIVNPNDYQEIKNICVNLKLKYAERTQTSLGQDCQVIRFDANSTRKILQYFGGHKNKGIKFIPTTILEADVETAKLFLETYIKGDGCEGCKIITTSKVISNNLMQVAVNAGYGTTLLTRKPEGISKKDRYIIRLVKHPDTYINKIKEVDYQGVIWCPNTKNETVIARRQGKIFITGNTPFTNVTLDVTPSPTVAEENVIIGGKVMPEKYKDFQEEMDMFNQAFAEIMLAGDSTGRVFGFPIPTYNIDKNFDWNRKCLEPAWEMTAKYGIPYFSNFVNSDMDRDDARSMCPLAGNEKVLIKSSRGRGLEYSEIRNIFEGNSKKDEYEIYSDGQFVKGRFNSFKNQKMIKVLLANGHEVKMSSEHLNFIKTGKTSPQKVVKGEKLIPGMYLPYSLNKYKGEGGSKDLGYFVGAYAGDGSFDGEGTVVFSLENVFKKRVIDKLQKIAIDYFGANSVVKEHKKTKLVSLKVHSRAAVGICKDFVAGKERNKHYQARLFDSSLEFRQAVFAGHYDTDGGNRNRIYTSSVKMMETLNMLAATLGTTTSIYKDDRTNRFGKETNYAVLFYQLNRNNYGDIWFKDVKTKRLWLKIKKIEKITNSTAYCFEVKGGKPLFTIGTTGILTHNCRLRLDNRELRKRGGGLFGANPLTGSLGVVTINLARLGHTSKTKEEFKEKLVRLMELAKDSLELKRKVIEKFTEDRLYPYSMVYLSDIHKRFGSYWKNHFSTVGVNGMNEAVLNLMGKDVSTPEGHAFAGEILDFMREKLMDFQTETNNLYNLEATPGEGCTYRFAKKDQEMYPDIICANSEAVKEGANPYYTNSTHLSVGFTEDIFSALDLQDDLQTKYTGGTVLHGYLGERLPDGGAAKKLVKKIVENYHLPYFTVTPTFSICPKHGYLSGEHKYCPKCDEEIGFKENVEEIRAANQS